MIVSAERSVVHWVEEGGGGFICMELSVSEISISDTKLSSLIHLWETFTATYVKLAGGACCKCMLLTSFFSFKVTDQASEHTGVIPDGPVGSSLHGLSIYQCD